MALAHKGGPVVVDVVVHPYALSLPSHHALSSDDLGRMMSVVSDVFDDVAKSRR